MIAAFGEQKKCEAHRGFALEIFLGFGYLLPIAGVLRCFHRFLDVVGEVAEEVDACSPLQFVDGYHAAL